MVGNPQLLQRFSVAEADKQAAVALAVRRNRLAILSRRFCEDSDVKSSGTADADRRIGEYLSVYYIQEDQRRENFRVRVIPRHGVDS